MATKLADRVKESTTTTGTGDYALGGAASGFQAFNAAFSNGDAVWYCCTDSTNWEVGVGTFTSPSTLARTTITASSNGGAAVNWGAGSKDVFSDLSAAAFASRFSVGPRVNSQTSTTSLTPNADLYDREKITALAGDLTVNAPSGAPGDEQGLQFIFKDDGTARTITWNAVFESAGASLPAGTVPGKWLRVGVIYNASASKWQCASVAQQV